MTKIVELFGGPGTGKSTSAAMVYAMLKQRGVNSELVREYVKDWAWEGRKISTYDQFYLMGKQIRRESMLYGKTDIVVTDSPVMMGIVYAQKYCPQSVAEGIRAGTLAMYRQAEEDGHEHVHVLLKRSKPYDPSGRFQTEAEARKVDDEVRVLLVQLKVKFVECGTDEESLRGLVESVLE